MNDKKEIIRDLFNGCDIMHVDDCLLVSDLFECSYIRILNNFCKSNKINIINISNGNYLLRLN